MAKGMAINCGRLSLSVLSANVLFRALKMRDFVFQRRAQNMGHLCNVNSELEANILLPLFADQLLGCVCSVLGPIETAAIWLIPRTSRRGV